jgi:hypothetical protein
MISSGELLGVGNRVAGAEVEDDAAMDGIGGNPRFF